MEHGIHGGTYAEAIQIIVLWLDVVEKGDKDDGLDLAAAQGDLVEGRGIDHVADGMRLFGIKIGWPSGLDRSFESLEYPTGKPDIIVGARHT